MAIDQNARRGDPHRKSGLPDLRTHKKPISGKPEIGAHFVSFNFTNTSIPALVSMAHQHVDRLLLAVNTAVANPIASAKLRR